MVWILSSIETASSKRLASIFQNGKRRKSRRRRRQPDITTIGENTQSECCLTKIAGYYYHSRGQHLVHETDLLNSVYTQPRKNRDIGNADGG
jgi:hypothetical protein